MLMAKARTAVIRNGKVIPGGTPFGIQESERDAMDARGFQIIETPDPLPPESGNVNSTPEKEPDGKTEISPEIKPEDLQASVAETASPAVLSGSHDKAAPKMGASKAKEKK